MVSDDSHEKTSSEDKTWPSREMGVFTEHMGWNLWRVGKPQATCRLPRPCGRSDPADAIPLPLLSDNAGPKRPASLDFIQLCEE